MKFPRPEFSRAQGETSSTKYAETALRERLKREKEEREWTEKERIATEKITRLEKEIETTAASITKYDRLKREKLEKERQNAGWWSYISSLFGTAEEKAKNRLEEADQKNRLFWMQYVAQHESKRFQDEKTEIKGKRAAQEKERNAQEARQEEEAVRKQTAREKETPERDLREHLRQNMDGEAARTAAAAKAEAEKENTRAETARRAKVESSQPPNPNPQPRPLDGSWQRRLPTTSHPAPQPSPTTPKPKSPPRPTPVRSHGPAMPKTQTVCTHQFQWPKVQGRHRCSACSQMLPMYIFRCDGCGVMACNDCRKTLKG